MSVSVFAARSILLDNAKPRRKNVEVAAVSVFDLDVIPDNVVSLNFLYTLVYTKSMLFMNYIISDLKVRKVGYLFTCILGLFLSLLPCMLP